jgi:hypothetical protein
MVGSFVLEARHELDTVGVYDGGTPDHATTLARMSVVGFLRERAFVNVARTTFGAVQDHRNSPVLGPLKEVWSYT